MFTTRCVIQRQQNLAAGELLFVYCPWSPACYPRQDRCTGPHSHAHWCDKYEWQIRAGTQWNFVWSFCLERQQAKRG